MIRNPQKLPQLLYMEVKVIFTIAVIGLGISIEVSAMSKCRGMLATVAGVCTTIAGCVSNPAVNDRTNNLIIANDPHREVTSADKQMLTRELEARGLGEHPALTIRYLPQLHSGLDMQPRTLEEIYKLESQAAVDATLKIQMQIAKSIRANPNLPVFMEGVRQVDAQGNPLKMDQAFLNSAREKSKNLKPEISNTWFIEPPHIYIRINKAFPNGLPREIKDLTTEQKSVLYQQGAAMVLYWTGELKNIGAVESEDIIKAVSDNGSIHWSGGGGSNLGNIYDLAYEKREVYAIGTLVSNAVQNDFSQMFLIYGLSHQLEDYTRDGLNIIREPVVEGSGFQLQITHP